MIGCCASREGSLAAVANVEEQSSFITSLQSSLSEKEKIIQFTVKSMQEANELKNHFTERLNKSKGMAGKHPFASKDQPG